MDNAITDNIYKIAFDAAACGLLFVDTNGSIQEANESLETMFGYQIGELSGKSIEILVPDTHAHGHVKKRREYLTNPTKRAMGLGQELMGQKKDGSLFPIEVGLTPIMAGAAQLTVASVVDLTEQAKAMNNALQKNEELESFIYTVSHDLKSPLITIGGFASRMLKSKSELDDKMKHYIERIRENARSMETLLMDILDISRISHRELELENTDLNELITHIIETHTEEIEELGAQIEVDKLPILACDQKRILQAFNNLIENALKYSEKDRKPIIEVKASTENNQTTILIKDNGRGIEPSHHDRVFRIFERLDKQTEGTGVGLTIVKAAIEKHGGKIYLDSKPGEGSTFSMVIPSRR